MQVVCPHFSNPEVWSYLGSGQVPRVSGFPKCLLFFLRAMQQSILVFRKNVSNKKQSQWHCVVFCHLHLTMITGKWHVQRNYNLLLLSRKRKCTGRKHVLCLKWILAKKSDWMENPPNTLCSMFPSPVSTWAAQPAFSNYSLFTDISQKALKSSTPYNINWVLTSF